MPIIYSVVSRAGTLLAKHATCPGNFDDVTEHILAQIPEEFSALTFAQGPYHFHYIRDNGLIYMCITDDEFQRTRAFLFLIEIKRKFTATYGSVFAVLPYVINIEFSLVLAREMDLCSTAEDIDTLFKAFGGLDEVQDIMARNIDSTSMSGERMRLLVNDNLPERHIEVISPEQARWMFRRSVALYTFIAILHVVLIYALVSLICGWSWQECV